MPIKLSVCRLRILTFSLCLATLGGVDAWAQLPAAAPQVMAPPASQPFIVTEMATRYRYDADGRGTRDSTFVVKIESDLGVRRWGQLAWVYMPESQQLTVPMIEVRKGDGRVIRPDASAITDSAVQPTAGISLLQDLRQLIITIPSLAVGDSLAIRTSLKIHTPMIPRHFWLEHGFTRQAVVLTELLEIDLPEGASPTIRVAPNAPVEASALKGKIENGRKLLRWTTSNLTVTPDTADEKDNQDDEPPAADVRVSTFSNWDVLAQWYESLATPAVVVDDKIRAKVADLTKGASTEDEKIQALYDFVSKDIRYVSLSFGVGRYSPHRAPNILADGYGDCKDKHTLLTAMLKAIGIRAFPVLANAARKVDVGMPSPAELNHLFTVIPRGTQPTDWLWLDTTPGVSPFRMLIATLRDRDVVVVAPELMRGAPIVHTPAAPPFALQTSVELDGKIDTIGTLKTRVRYTARSDEELLMRSVFANLAPEQVKEPIKALSGAIGLGDGVQEFKILHLESTREPLVIEFTVTKTGLFKWTTKGADLPLPLQQLTLPSRTEADWKNKTRATLGPPTTVSLKAALEMPAGFTPSLPVGINVVRDGYAFTSSYRYDGRTVSAERTFRSTTSEIPASAAPEYLAFTRAVRTDEEQHLSLAFDTSLAPDIPADATARDLYSAGFAAYENKRYDVALTYWLSVTKLDSKHDSAWDAIGMAYEKLGRLDEAVQALRRQTEINPFHNQAYRDLARVLQSQHKRDDARKALMKHIDITPLDGSALSDLGELLLDDGANAEALPYLERASALAKNNAWTQAYLGAAYARLKEPSKARAAFENAIALSDTPAIGIKCAWELSNAGLELAWADELARRSLTRLGDTMRTLSLATLRSTQWDLAERIGWAWDAIGWVQFQRGDLKGAERYVKAAWEFSGRPEMAGRLGQIYEKQQRLSDAGSAYLMSLALGDKSKEVTGHAQRLLGASAADLPEFIAGARQEAAMERMISIKSGPPVDGQARLTVLVNADGSIGDLRFDEGDESMRPMTAALKAAVFRLRFPDASVPQLPAKVMIQCIAARGECAAALGPATARER